MADGRGVKKGKRWCGEEVVKKNVKSRGGSEHRAEERGVEESEVYRCESSLIETIVVILK